MSLREDLAARLAHLESHLAEQILEAEATRTQIRETMAQLQSIEAAPPQATSPTGPQTSVEKVGLFRSLFRGREDVYRAMGYRVDDAHGLPLLEGID